MLAYNVTQVGKYLSTVGRIVRLVCPGFVNFRQLAHSGLHCGNFSVLQCGGYDGSDQLRYTDAFPWVSIFVVGNVGGVYVCLLE
jgi:hypothetical protein